MGKKLDYTPRSRIRQAIRRYIWLRSRERQAALRRDNYTCQCCGKKQSRAKGREVYVEVHHINGIEHFDRIIDGIYKYLLCHPDLLQTLCVECHEKIKKTVDKNENV